MSLVRLPYCSSSRLSCCSCLPADVILCIPAEFIAPHLCPDAIYEQTYEYRHIEAQLVSATKSVNCGFNTTYSYVFEFDDEQLSIFSSLLSTDIQGVFCKGCLTNWVEDIVGNEIEIDVGEYEVSITSQHGCVTTFEVGGGGTGVELLVEDTETVDLTLTGTDPQTLTADVEVSADAGNALTTHADGLFVPSGSGSGWSLTGDAGTVVGVNFIGTLDDVAHDVRVNNIRIRHNLPDVDGICSNIIDGGPDTILGGADSITGVLTGVTVGGGGSDPENGSTPHEVADGYFTTIGGGAGNLFIPDASPNGDGFGAGYGTIGGGLNNIIQMDIIPWTHGSPGTNFQGSNTIAGGFDNLIICSDYNTIGGGFVNLIEYDASFPAGLPAVNDYIWGDTIAGGVVNQILGNTEVPVASGGVLPDLLGANYIGGGDSNELINSYRSGIGCGLTNNIQHVQPGANQIATLTPNGLKNGPWLGDFIGGGHDNWIAGSGRCSILGGGGNYIAGCDSSTILGGFINVILATTLQVLEDPVPDPLADPGSSNTIIGGEANRILNGFCTTHLGGAFLQLGSASIGYQSPTTRSFANIDGNNTRRYLNGFSANTFEAVQVTLAAFSDIAYFGDVDIWVANTNSTATKVKFIEPNADTDFSSANYSSLQAQAQGANIEYVFPAAAGVAGQSLKIQSVVGVVVTLEWA